MRPPVEWRPVVGFEELYEVSNSGVVRRLAPAIGLAWVGRPVRPHLNHRGYLRLTLWKNGKQKKAFVHELVAAAFLGPCPAGQQVNHKDGVKTNNRVGNLEYVTHLENMHHAMEMGLMPGKLDAAMVVEMRQRRRSEGTSYAQLARDYGINATTAADVVNRRLWRHVPDPAVIPAPIQELWPWEPPEQLPLVLTS